MASQKADDTVGSSWGEKTSEMKDQEDWQL